MTPDTINAVNLVVVESPLAGEFEQNQRYARWCCRDAMLRCGEQPMASHLLYTQFLNDEVAEEREAGIAAGLAWAKAAGARHAYYVDLCDCTSSFIPAGDQWIEARSGLWFAFSSGMCRAWAQSPGPVRSLFDSNREFWSRFEAGEEPPRTRGAL